MWRKYVNNKKFFIGFIIIVIIILIGLSAPLITKYEPYQTYVGPALEGPSLAHPFGTDQLGRDNFSRVIYGTRLSLLVALLVSSICFVVGVTLGMLSGYYGKAIDTLVMRIVDFFFTIPWILIGLIMVIIRGPGLLSVVYTLSLAFFTTFARVTRSLVLELKEQDYVKAAVLTGENDFIIMVKYILPNCMSSLIIQTTIVMSFAILGEAALSYLGYGIRPPEPSWGILLQQATNYLWGNGYLVIIPGLFIVFTVLSFNFLGDGLRDILDPRYKRIYE